MQRVLLNVSEFLGFVLPVGQAREAVEWCELPNVDRCADYMWPGRQAREAVRQSQLLNVVRFAGLARLSAGGGSRWRHCRHLTRGLVADGGSSACESEV